MKLNDFIAYLLSKVDKAIYIWGGQGHIITSETQIAKYESDPSDREKAVKLWRKRKEAGVDPIEAYDCSGLGVHWLLDIAHIIKSDMTANGLMGKCTKLSKSQLKKGDWVFKVYTTGANKGMAYHIGYIVDDALNVVESRGRAYGVVKRALSAGGWNAYGRPSYFKDEIEPTHAEPQTVIAFTNGTNIKNGAKGEIVRIIQHNLNVMHNAMLVEDGEFGKKTYEAVRAFQKAKGLKVDGVVGEKTTAALGGTWVKTSTPPTPSPAPKQEIYQYAGATYTNIRNAVGGNIVGKVNKGEKVIKLGSTSYKGETWWNVQHVTSGVVGYMANTHLLKKV